MWSTIVTLVGFSLIMSTTCRVVVFMQCSLRFTSPEVLAVLFLISFRLPRSNWIGETTSKLASVFSVDVSSTGVLCLASPILVVHSLIIIIIIIFIISSIIFIIITILSFLLFLLFCMRYYWDERPWYESAVRSTSVPPSTR